MLAAPSDPRLKAPQHPRGEDSVCIDRGGDTRQNIPTPSMESTHQSIDPSRQGANTTPVITRDEAEYQCLAAQHKPSLLRRWCKPDEGVLYPPPLPTADEELSPLGQFRAIGQYKHTLQAYHDHLEAQAGRLYGCAYEMYSEVDLKSDRTAPREGERVYSAAEITTIGTPARTNKKPTNRTDSDLYKPTKATVHAMDIKESPTKQAHEMYMDVKLDPQDPNIPPHGRSEPKNGGNLSDQKPHFSRYAKPANYARNNWHKPRTSRQQNHYASSWNNDSNSDRRADPPNTTTLVKSEPRDTLKCLDGRDNNEKEKDSATTAHHALVVVPNDVLEHPEDFALIRGDTDYRTSVGGAFRTGCKTYLKSENGVGTTAALPTVLTREQRVASTFNFDNRNQKRKNKKKRIDPLHPRPDPQPQIRQKFSKHREPAWEYVDPAYVKPEPIIKPLERKRERSTTDRTPSRIDTDRNTTEVDMDGLELADYTDSDSEIAKIPMPGEAAQTRLQFEYETTTTQTVETKPI